MQNRLLTFSLSAEPLAVCRLGPNEEIPPWAAKGKFLSVTRTTEELSILCPEELVPPGVKCEKGWRCLKVEGSFDLSASGVVASFATPLANAGVGILVISTFDTDYLMIRESELEKGILLLLEEGHKVHR